MIQQGFISHRLCSNVFKVRVGDRNHKIMIRQNSFQQEWIRLAGHTCEAVGFVPGLALEAEFDDGGQIVDVRFDLPDGEPEIREISIVESTLADGATCFLKRPCGCSIFCGYKAVLVNHPFGGFVVGQRFSHCAGLDAEGRLQAADVRILDLNPPQIL